MTSEMIVTIIAIVAVIVGGVALTVGTIALSLVIGIKNSTHQVIWKPLEEPKTPEEVEDEDPFIYSEAENPNKKIKPKDDEEDFADLSDPSVTSNDW